MWAAGFISVQSGNGSVVAGRESSLAVMFSDTFWFVVVLTCAALGALDLAKAIVLLLQGLWRGADLMSRSESLENYCDRRIHDVHMAKVEAMADFDRQIETLEKRKAEASARGR